ncbi:hypothetical protein [Parabacteroides gordonii]|uniref:hypothetical protein n=1 Tax=Parabacteroides gordonii TaxID=574930 RepID=UPI0024201BC6|nr:hypothetical protein [Parabacteroides gordonii]
MKKRSLFIIAWTGLLLGSSCRSLSPEENCRYRSEAVDLQIVSADSSRVAGHSCFQVDNHFVWGASPIQGEDGKYYLVFAGFETGTYRFSDAWVLGSKLGLAVSDKPDGGYHFLGFFLNQDGYAPDTSSWDAQTVHNPHIRKFDGKYYLYYIGGADPIGQVSIRCSSGELDRRSRIQQWLKIGVIEFDSFDQLLKGDYTHSTQPLLTPRTRVKQDAIVDPSPEGTKSMPEGDTIRVDRLERPQLLLDEKGNPLILYAACSVVDVNPRTDGGCFNVQIPLLSY